jgi:alkylhydroperoxidase/carboxymuconolactone decarboxylase family protein
MADYFNSEDLARFAETGKSAPELFNLFMKWYGESTKAGALDAKTKAIIALAVAHTIPCPYCIDAWTTGALKEGATPEELAEAIQVTAALKAGATIAFHIQSLNVMERG